MAPGATLVDRFLDALMTEGRMPPVFQNASDHCDSTGLCRDCLASAMGCKAAAALQQCAMVADPMAVRDRITIDF